MTADDGIIRLVTRCSSEAEFIERFARFATETDLLVPALPHVGVGTDGHFEICLQDRAPIMRGRCEITEIQPVTAPPGTVSPVRALMRLRLREMDAHSCGIHLRLMERHAPAQDAATGAVAAPAARAETERTEVSPGVHAETRVPGAAFTLPANPLGELAAADLASFIELNLFESDASGDAAPAGPAPAAVVAQPAPKTPAPPRAPAALLSARLERARRIARRVAPYAACALGGLMLGIALRTASGAPPAVAAAPAPVAPPPVAAPPPVVVPRAEPPPAMAPDPEPRAVLVARSSRRPARVVVTSSPPRAIIKLNDRRLGPAPRTISTRRFEQLRIEASLPGYQTSQQIVRVEETRSKVVVTLVRAPSSAAQPATPVSAPLARLR